MNDATVNSILSGDAKIMVEEAEKLARCPKLTASQLRKFFGTIKSIELRFFAEEVEKRKELGAYGNELMLLIPKIFYAVARANAKPGDELLSFRDDIAKLIKKVATEDSSEKFKHFCDFFEALVAYHKVYNK